MQETAQIPGPRVVDGLDLLKAPTGIAGLDTILDGGLPRERCSLVCGGPGSGKTLLGAEFLLRGARDMGEPGVFVAFEESAEDLITNVRSLGFDLRSLIEDKLVYVDHIELEPRYQFESGAFDLNGLFIQLDRAIDSVGAKRVVLDTIETLFSGFSNHATLRAELRRLFHWLKDRGVTTIITGERGSGTLTREGLEEYVSDCVIEVDQRFEGDVSTRRMRVIKYRGSKHGTNSYPFLIGRDGLSVVPITSIHLDHAASTERVSSGTPSLDAILGGGGFFRGSSILVSGAAGTGKTSILASFVAAGCARGERALYIALEESPAQITRNVSSIGIDLKAPVDDGLLRFHARRPTMQGLEMHLAEIVNELRTFSPDVVVMDPITNLDVVGSLYEVRMTLLHLIDQLKSRGITSMASALTGNEVSSDVGVSSLMDTWLSLTNAREQGRRTRLLSVQKSRGMDHSNREHVLALSSAGVQLHEIDDER